MERGGYDAEYLHVEDTELWSRLINVTRFANLQDKIFRRRWHSGSICNTHAERQKQVDLIIRQRLMESSLKQPVTESLAGYLSGAHEVTSASADEIAHLGRLIFRLYRAIILDPRISTAERKMIRQDAARRLLDLGRLRFRNPQAWSTLGLACWLEPNLLIQAGSARLRRLLRK